VGRQEVKQFPQARGGQTHARIRGAVVHLQGVAVRAENSARRKHDVLNISDPFIGRERPEDPLVAPVEDFERILAIEQHQADPVQAARRRHSNAVVKDQPAGSRLDGRSGQADLPGVPPCPAARRQQDPVTAPVTQVGGKRDPDMCRTRSGHGPMNDGPVTSETPREQSGVLVLRRQDQAVVVEVLEVAGKRQRDTGAAFGKRRVDHAVAIQLRDPGDPGILDSPQLLRPLFPVGQQGGPRVDSPVRDAIRRTGGAEVRQTPAVLGPYQQEDLAGIDETDRTRIEDGVDRIGPVLGLQNRVAVKAPEQLLMLLILRRVERIPTRTLVGRTKAGVVLHR